MAKIEVITGTESRRKWSDKQKAAIVKESLEPGVVIAHIAKRHKIPGSLLYVWRNQFKNQTTDVSQETRSLIMHSDRQNENGAVKNLSDRVRQLEQILGRKVMELEILKAVLPQSQTPMHDDKTQDNYFPS